jgi:predicted phosphodiesterase
MRRILLLSVVLAATLWGAAVSPAAKLAAGPWAVPADDHSVAIAWEAGEKTGEVQWGTEPAHLDRVAPASAFAEHFFRAVLRNLAPGAKIYYRVKAGDTLDAPAEFAAPGGPGDSFVFAGYGDSRSNPDRHAKVIAALLREDPVLVVHTGDFVLASRPLLWREYFATADPLLRRSLLLPSKGNHEAFGALGGGDPDFNTLFQIPGLPPENTSRRVVQYNGVRFIVLDTTLPCDADTPQYTWLKEQLAAAASAPDVKFLVATEHYAPYSISTHGKDANVLRFRAAAAPLFKAYGVDLVLSGHDHNYQHALVDGVHYLVLGGGGAPAYSDFDRQPWTVCYRDSLNYVRVEASPAHLHLTAKDPDGNIIDQFLIEARERRATP